MLQRYLTEGIDLPSAEEFARVFKSMPVSRWPLVHRLKLLHGRKQSGRVNVTDMTESHAMAISKSRRRGKRRDAFAEACHAADLTQNGLAAKLHISAASLSRYRDDRPIPRKTADEVKRLIGYAGPWPAGIVE